MTLRVYEMARGMAKRGMRYIRKKYTARDTRLVPFTKVVTTTVPVYGTHLRDAIQISE